MLCNKRTLSLTNSNLFRRSNLFVTIPFHLLYTKRFILLYDATSEVILFSFDLIYNKIISNVINIIIFTECRLFFVVYKRFAAASPYIQATREKNTKCMASLSLHKRQNFYYMHSLFPKSRHFWTRTDISTFVKKEQKQKRDFFVTKHRNNEKTKRRIVAHISC